MRSLLSIKLNLRMILIAGVCFTAIALVESYNTKAALDEQLESTLAEVTSRLSNSLALPVWNVDIEVIASIVETEMQNKYVHTVTVRDNLTETTIVNKSRDDGWNVVDTPESKSLTDDRTAEMSIILNDINLGSVVVGVTDRFLQDSLRAAMGKLVVRTMLLLFLIMIVLMIFINVHVSRPIMSLSQVCRKVAYGDYDLEIDVQRKDEIGSLARSFVYMRDRVKEKIYSLNEEIGERRRFGEEIQKLRAFLTNIVDSMPSILVGVDSDMQVTLWNLEAQRATSISNEMALGAPLEVVFPALSSDLEDIQRAIHTREGHQESRIEIDVGDERRVYEKTIYPLVGGAGNGAVIRLDDISERMRIEEIMVQTEKMMSVGGLAAGMAHEINNPLAGVMQSVQVINSRLSPKLTKNRVAAEECGISMEAIQDYMRRRDIDKMLSSILEAGERAVRIISNMLSFSRKSTSQYTLCDMGELLDKTVELAANDYDMRKSFDFRRIEITREYQLGLAKVRCDATTIQQVFLNILKNAAQALHIDGAWENGRTAPEITPRIFLKVYADQQTVKIDIEDNGIGMNEEVRKRIFEPFFTTKAIGLGTGLGLSVSYFIIKENHRGSIEVESRKHQGTCFTISLPC